LFNLAAFDKLMAVNARSVMLCYKYGAKQMIAQGGGGRIISTYTCACVGYSDAYMGLTGASSLAGKQGNHDPLCALSEPA
jgi:NAD(P)-dependent dehydrogenase (short-subunit alcohol dehydrogenase family)